MTGDKKKGSNVEKGIEQDGWGDLQSIIISGVYSGLKCKGEVHPR